MQQAAMIAGESPIEEILFLASAMSEKDRETLLVIARALKDGRIDDEYLSGSVHVAMHPELKGVGK